MKIAARLISGVGRVLLGSALTLFLVALALFGIASYLVSWPYRKLYSPREASLRLTLDLLTIASAAWHLRAAQGASERPPWAAQVPADPPAAEPVEPRA